MLDQKSPQLVFERNGLVMFFLTLDVFNHRVLVIVRNGERAVAILPMREIRKDAVLFDPTTGAGFDVFDQISQRDGRMNLGHDVNVIFHAADAVEVAVFVFQDAPGVAEQVVASVGEQHAFPVLRGEDDVEIDLGERGHGGLGSCEVAVVVGRCG